MKLQDLQYNDTSRSIPTSSRWSHGFGQGCRGLDALLGLEAPGVDSESGSLVSRDRRYEEDRR